MDSGRSRRRWLPRLRRDADREIEEELAFHLEERVREYVSHGMDPEEARAVALARLGELRGVRDECSRLLSAEQRREATRERMLFSWLDVKLGLRLLLRYPGLTVVGGLAMAFAIAVGAGAFEIVKQYVDPALPLPDGDRIVALRHIDTRYTEVSRPSSADFLAWREQLQRVEELSAARTVQRNLSVDGSDSRPETVAEITPSAFRVTRTPPLLGRALVEGDEAPGAPPVLVIGHALWMSRFGGDAAAIGRSVRLGGVETTVVGVMPEGFRFPLAHDLWTPLRPTRGDTDDPGGGLGGSLHVFGRLAEGESRASAAAELSALGARAAVASPDTHGHLIPELVPYVHDLTSVDVPPGMERLVYAINVFFVMLLVVVCANVALLMFARVASRENEIVVRSALGAARSRIVGQLFAEALVLGALAAVLGLSVARFAVAEWLRVMTAESNGGMPFWFEARLAPTTVVYAVLLTLLGAAVAGVVPALRMTGRGVGAHLRQLAAGAGGARLGGMWTAAVVAQVAITVAFPAASYFAWRYVDGMRSIDVGFPAGEYLSVRLQMDPPQDGPGGASSAATLSTVARELEERLLAEPGVGAVTFASRLPRTLHPRGWIEVEDTPAATSVLPRHPATVARVDADYFEALGVSVLAGRAFGSGDAAPDAVGEAPNVVVVNRSFVERVLGGRNAIGRRIRYQGDAPQPWYEVVGVVPDLGTVTDDPFNLSGVYHPLTASTAPLHLVVRTPGGPEAFAPRLRALAADVDPDLRLHDVLPLDLVGESLWLESAFIFKVLAGLSAVALLLSLAGVYATTAFAVARRRREIGIRLALGGPAPRVLSVIFARPLGQVAAGVFFGGCLTALLGWAVLRATASPTGVLWVVAYAALMMVVCMLACVVPTRRALAVEPSEALRMEG